MAPRPPATPEMELRFAMAQMARRARHDRPPTERSKRSDVSEPRARSTRAVLDTNVLLRGLPRATGPSQEILEALVDAKAFVLVT
jgi:hypothetical protein